MRKITSPKSVARIAGVIYLSCSVAFVLLHMIFPSSLTDAGPVLSILIPLLGWSFVCLLLIQLSRRDISNIWIFQDWRFLQLFAGMLAAIYNHAVLYSLDKVCTFQDKGEVFLDCIYFSAVTWTTLGYGDLSPNHATKLVASSQAMMGSLSLALIAGLALKSGISSALEKNIEQADQN